MTATGRQWIGALALATAGLLGQGCQTYQQQGQVMTTQWDLGNFAGAAKEFGLKAEKEKATKDALIWRLEQATALRATGQYKESNDAFDQAEQKVNTFEEQAKVKVGREAGALLSNQANLPYDGRTYDKVMLNTYKALNYLQLGDQEKARVELNRTYQRQQDAVEQNKKRIEAVEEAAAKEKDKAAMDKARNDTKFKGALETQYAALDQLKAYADYVNPFSVFMDGLFFLYQATGGSDLERSRKSLERVLGFAGESKYIKEDLEQVEAVTAAKPVEPTTYVIFETGGAPVRDQIRIDIPIIVAKVSYVGAAFPKIKFRDNHVTGLKVSGGGAAEQTVSIASMDSVVGHDFKNELPMIITKTMAATVAKAIAAYAANEAASQADSTLGLFMKIATAGYQAAVNIADLRTWTTLPKEFQYCRIPTPADRKITVAGVNSSHSAEVTVDEGKVNVIFVRSVNSGAPFIVSQFKLQ
jgi:hypothetical protein